MPSPVGHSLIGLGLGLGVLSPRGAWRDLLAFARRNWAALLLVVAMANAPDVDYIPGVLVGRINAYHHLYTHTLGWIALVAAGAWLVARAFRPGFGWVWLPIFFAALATHLLADLVTEDTAAPYGIMALWPFTDRFYLSPVTIFRHLEKAEWADVFQLYNLKVLLLEALWCIPLVAGVVIWKVRVGVPRREPW